MMDNLKSKVVSLELAKRKEIWKDIEDYKGLYQASNFGRIKRLYKNERGYNQNGKEYILKSSMLGKYYKAVSLSRDNKRKTFFVHRLVAQTFILNPQNKRQVNHIDCDPLNNRVDNLEWVTPLENSAHAVKNGLMADMKGSKNPQAILTEEIVKDIKWLLQYERCRTIKTIANDYGVSPQAIYDIKHGRRWKHVYI